MSRSVVVFDLGGVLIRWDPRNLYRGLFAGDEAAMEEFLANVCTTEWNERQDAGRSFADACAEIIPQHPGKEPLIRAFGERFDEMIPGPVEGTVAVLRDLKNRGTRLYALTNWSAETFPPQRKRFEFLSWFDGIVVSGEERLIKPDARLFRRLLDRYKVSAHDAVFIDDSEPNVHAAEALGIHGVHFTAPEVLRADLKSLNLL